MAKTNLSNILVVIFDNDQGLLFDLMACMRLVLTSKEITECFAKLYFNPKFQNIIYHGLRRPHKSEIFQKFASYLKLENYFLTKNSDLSHFYFYSNQPCALQEKEIINSYRKQHFEYFYKNLF
jgi:hypothetical protein